MEKKTEILVRLTGLRIYTGKSKARGPRNALPSVGHNVGPWALFSPVQIRKPVSKKISTVNTAFLPPIYEKGLKTINKEKVREIGRFTRIEVLVKH